MEMYSVRNDSCNKTQKDKTYNMKNFIELCSIITNARQCVSIEFNSHEYKLKKKINQVLEFVKIDATVLTRQNMLLSERETVSNVIFCLEDNECLFVNTKLNYIIHYSPKNKVPNLLIHRFLSIHYINYQLMSLFDDSTTNNNCTLDDWMLCILFTAITSIHRDCTSVEVIDILSKQFDDNEVLLNFQDLCNVVSSNQASMCKMDIHRPHISYTKLYPRRVSQNINKVLEILHDIVSWCCMSINTDEQRRNDKLYCNVIDTIELKNTKKHIEISKTMVYDTIVKLWNRLNYELTLNNNNVEIIKQTFKNIIHHWSVHYKYIILVFINLVQSNNDVSSDINNHSYTIVSLTEEYDEKIREMIVLADSMNELINEVLK